MKIYSFRFTKFEKSHTNKERIIFIYTFILYISIYITGMLLPPFFYYLWFYISFQYTIDYIILL